LNSRAPRLVILPPKTPMFLRRSSYLFVLSHRFFVRPLRPPKRKTTPPTRLVRECFDPLPSPLPPTVGISPSQNGTPHVFSPLSRQEIEPPFQGSLLTFLSLYKILLFPFLFPHFHGRIVWNSTKLFFFSSSGGLRCFLTPWEVDR